MRGVHGPAKAGHYLHVKAGHDLHAKAGRYLLVALLVLLARPVTAQQSPADGAPKGFDFILDTYVRDGYVYYRALKQERGKLDAYVAQLAAQNKAQLDRQPREAQLAFWLNAYDALVLRTVIDHYPIQGRSATYPKQSIRQIPGAFERLPHTVAGRTLTLDQIEQTVLADFHDPRVHVAIGRGAVGGGRLRSEAFTPDRLEAQLAEAAAECANRSVCVRVDRDADTLTVSPVFSWNEKAFVAAYSGAASPAFAERSPLERAVLAFVSPKLLTTERDALAKNTFRMTFLPFDWSLNDLTGRGGR